MEAAGRHDERIGRFLADLIERPSLSRREQFYRARVYGKDSHLVGWTVDRVVLSDFEKEPTFASDKTCSTAD